MHLDITDQELDYVYRLLISRPMVEVEALVAKIRQQVAVQHQPIPLPNGDAQAKQETVQ